MQIKSINPINFLFFRTETTVNELVKFLPVGQELYTEAVANKLSVTGPIHWHYFGFEGDPLKAFQLEVALPVAEVAGDYDGKFHFKRTALFKCLSLFHEGSWLDLPKSYGMAMEHLAKNHLTPNAQNREIYINTDFKKPEANFTEIQIGINS